MRNTLTGLASALVATLALAAAPVAAEQDVRTRVLDFFQEIQTLQASFTQTVSGEDGEVVQRSKGKVWIARPDRFRWDYRTPYEQLIVGDGEWIWIYDQDLEQVTRKPLEQGLDNGAMMLLSGRGDIEAQFRIEAGKHKDGLDWIELRPRRRETEFSNVRVGLDGRAIRAMTLRDAFGQVTHLTFDDIELNPDIPDRRFRFTPPEGVDVIRGSP